jgi:hypothetical protein
MFREEMSAERQPPLGGLVEDAVRDGRRARRNRRILIALGSTGVAATVAVAAAVVVAPGGDGGGATTSSQHAGTPQRNPLPVLAASSTSTVIKQPAGPKSPVTDAAVIEQLARLVPKGRISGFAQGPKEAGRYAFGQLYLDTGKGPGMIRAFVYKGGLSDEACSTTAPDKALESKKKYVLKMAKSEQERQQIRKRFEAAERQHRPGCRDLPGGGRALVETDTTGETSASVDHGNGVVIQVFTATWLAWNGTLNPRGTIALTPAQVLKIAAYPGWGVKMDSALVTKAATDYRSLPTVY